MKNRPQLNDGSCPYRGEVYTVISCMTTAAMPDLAPTNADAPLACLMAGIEVTQIADFRTIPDFEH